MLTNNLGLPYGDNGMAALPKGIEIYTSEEVAKTLKISHRRVLRLFARGELRGFRTGKSWRMTKENLQAFIDASPETEGSADDDPHRRD